MADDYIELDDIPAYCESLHAEIERLRGQILLEQDRVKLLKEELDHLREVVRLLNDDKHLDAWEEK